MQYLDADDKALGISHINTVSKICFWWVDSSALRHIFISLLFLSTAVLPRTNLASCSTNVVSAVSWKTLALPLLEHRPLYPETKPACVQNKAMWQLFLRICLHIYRCATLETYMHIFIRYCMCLHAHVCVFWLSPEYIYIHLYQTLGNITNKSNI